MRRLILLSVGLMFYACLFAQSRVVSGIITDNNGQPLPDVTIKVAGGTAGTSTNARGFFSLSVPSGATMLEITSVGFVGQTIPVPSQGSVTVSLLDLILSW